MGKLETPVYIVIILQLQHTFGENEIVEFIFSYKLNCDFLMHPILIAIYS
jgi:hypothetical protein